nr:butyrophilin subfamily 1 member A1-like isoform X3 [Pelodiscus sinensis]|eukprot:XP_025038775.1 butyrophilin subfamily 1 member A1-like isoform X3 [Pelodiscus sinensis]
MKACTVMESTFQWVSPLLLLIFLQMPHLIAGRFTIIPPQNPVIAVIGEDVVLPCQLTAADNPDTITVQWILSRPPNKIEVSTYDGQIKEVRRDERYQGRTQFFQTEFRAGNVSLNLKDIKVSDKGKYTCSVSLNTWYDEVVVELDVTDVFFPTTSPWMAAFLVILFLSIATIAAVGYKLKKNNDTKSNSVNEKKKMEEEKERLLSALETNKRTDAIAIQDIQENSERLSTELDFRRAQSYAVAITLDPDCKHPELRLSEDKKRVWREAASPQPAAASRALLVVGRKGFVDGRQYWEVEVGCKGDWELGVLSQAARETVKREEAATLPGEGCWSLRRSQGDLFSSPENKKIEKRDATYAVIGVFLDREEGRISFYDAGMMFPIVTIPAGLTEKCLYYPFLSPGNSTGEQKPLTILPVRVPVPLQPLRKEK